MRVTRTGEGSWPMSCAHGLDAPRSRAPTGQAACACIGSRGIAEEGGIQTNCWREAGVVWNDCVGLFDHHAVGICAPTFEKECNAPKHATVATFVVCVRFVAQGLVRAWGPQERPSKPAERKEGGNIPNVVHTRCFRLPQIDGQRQLAVL
eukprot:2053065-Pleurochrysis_carterae.AAC.1